MRVPPALPLAVLVLVPLRGQEIAVDPPRSPLCVIAQTVTVTVAAGMSMVEGRFDLKYVPRFDAIPPADTLPFEFTVVIPKELDDLQGVTDATQIKLRVGSASFDPSDCLPMPVSHRVSALLPADTRVMLVRFEVPRPVLQQRSTLHLTYFQPNYHLAGREVSAFLPLLPDFETLKNELLFSRDDFTVEFQTTGSVRLRRISPNAAVVTSRPEEVKVHPIDRELIAVEVDPAAAPPPKPSPAGP